MDPDPESLNPKLLSMNNTRHRARFVRPDVHASGDWIPVDGWETCKWMRSDFIAPQQHPNIADVCETLLKASSSRPGLLRNPMFATGRPSRCDQRPGGGRGPLRVGDMDAFADILVETKTVSAGSVTLDCSLESRNSHKCRPRGACNDKWPCCHFGSPSY